MSKKPAATFGPNLLDVRVRERYLGNGLLDPKVLEKHHSELPDLSDRTETVDLDQPALSGSGLDEPEGDD